MKDIFLVQLIRNTNRAGLNINFDVIATVLNKHGFRTKSGSTYVIGGRGIARLVSALYKRMSLRRPNIAHLIAVTVVNRKGKWAW